MIDPTSSPQDPPDPLWVLSSQATTDAASRRARVLLQARRARARRGSRGVALLMVLGTLSILTVMLTEFQDATSAELGSSIAARDQVRAEYAAKSAVNLTRLLIAAEPTVRASPIGLMVGGAQIPVWEYTDVILGAFNDADGGAVFEGISGMNLAEGRNLGMDGAGFELVVVDEDSKINLNTSARANVASKTAMAAQIHTLIGGIQYNDFFEEAEDEKGNRLDRFTVCTALMDWADPDTDRSSCDPQDKTASATAPEDSYYQLLSRPYARKNAAYDSLEELHLVQGVSEGFWSRFIQPDPDDPKSRIVTVWGSDKVNVNTANPTVLLTKACEQAKPETPLCNDPILQQKYLMTMSMFAGMMSGIPVFSSPQNFVDGIRGKGMLGEMLNNFGIPPVEIPVPKLLLESITVESKVFSIYATGYVKSGQRKTRSRIHAVVDMRGAPPPGSADQFARLSQITSGGLDPEATDDKKGSGLGLGDLPDDFEEGGIMNALLPRAGGTVLYFRVD